MRNALKYLAVVLFCLLWSLRFGVTPQGYGVVSPQPDKAASEMTGPFWFAQAEEGRLMASLYHDVLPGNGADRVDHVPGPSLRINSSVRFIAVPDGISQIHSRVNQSQVRAQKNDSARMRALLEESDYYIYALRKIII